MLLPLLRRHAARRMRRPPCHGLATTDTLICHFEVTFIRDARFCHAFIACLFDARSTENHRPARPEQTIAADDVSDASAAIIRHHCRHAVSMPCRAGLILLLLVFTARRRRSSVARQPATHQTGCAHHRPPSPRRSRLLYVHPLCFAFFCHTAWRRLINHAQRPLTLFSLSPPPATPSDATLTRVSSSRPLRQPSSRHRHRPPHHSSRTSPRRQRMPYATAIRIFF